MCCQEAEKANCAVVIMWLLACCDTTRLILCHPKCLSVSALLADIYMISTIILCTYHQPILAGFKANRSLTHSASPKCTLIVVSIQGLWVLHSAQCPHVLLRKHAWWPRTEMSRCNLTLNNSILPHHLPNEKHFLCQTRNYCYKMRPTIGHRVVLYWNMKSWKTCLR